MRSTSLLRSAAVAGVLSLAPLGFAATPAVAGVAFDGPVACDTGSSAARVKAGANVQEPALYSEKQAKQYGVIKDLPSLDPGSVTIDTVFHVITDSEPTAADRTRLTSMVDAQIDVLNDAYSGATSPDAADTPFRFALSQDVNFVTNDAWANVAPARPSAT